MPDLIDGETAEVKGSARLPYVLKNTGGVYSCTCPAWRNQSIAIERRTCKHLRAFRGEQAEKDRVGGELPARSPKQKSDDASTVPGLLLAHTWENDLDLTDWWMSEKLDGVRAYWDGKQFVSRQGNVYHAPDFFVAGLPELPLDGELWMGRKAFQRCVSIVRRQDKSDLWQSIRFLVFDMPTAGGPFEERLEQLRDCLAPNRARFAEIHEHDRCRGLDHLREELARVEALGGEGLMLRQPGSPYEAGRSPTLLKVKTFHDAEARVVEHLPGTGRHKGRLGALGVVLPDGTSFSIGTGFSDAERDHPPAIGSVVTFRYQELSDRGVPRFPSFVRVRQEGPVGAAPMREKRASQSSPPTSRDNQVHGKTRHFEFVEGGSAKFWEISSSGTDVTVRFGRLGTQGQTQTKNFADAEAAERHVEKLIGEKTKKGYVEK
ncbi:MAG TPA: DNA ligase [Pirellulales bacterium]|nr:DNA ligase [Pirellulales bacterium]